MSHERMFIRNNRIDKFFNRSNVCEKKSLFHCRVLKPKFIHLLNEVQILDILSDSIIINIVDLLSKIQRSVQRRICWDTSNVLDSVFLVFEVISFDQSVYFIMNLFKVKNFLIFSLSLERRNCISFYLLIIWHEILAWSFYRI